MSEDPNKLDKNITLNLTTVPRADPRKFLEEKFSEAMDYIFGKNEDAK